MQRILISYNLGSHSHTCKLCEPTGCFLTLFGFGFRVSALDITMVQLYGSEPKTFCIHTIQVTGLENDTAMG